LPTGAGLRPVGGTGMVWNPVTGVWGLVEWDLSVVYVAAGVCG